MSMFWSSCMFKSSMSGSAVAVQLTQVVACEWLLCNTLYFDLLICKVSKVCYAFLCVYTSCNDYIYLIQWHVLYSKTLHKGAHTCSKWGMYLQFGFRQVSNHVKCMKQPFKHCINLVRIGVCTPKHLLRRLLGRPHWSVILLLTFWDAVLNFQQGIWRILDV